MNAAATTTTATAAVIFPNVLFPSALKCAIDRRRAARQSTERSTTTPVRLPSGKKKNEIKKKIIRV